MSYSYEYPRPAMTVDIAILFPADKGHEILLIERGQEPFKGAWALPGGFLDMDEELQDAAARELEEETGLKNLALKEVGVFGKIGRDPRGRTITVVYLAMLDHKPQAKAGDDASNVGWFPLDQPPELAFDHSDILQKIRQDLKDG